MLWDYIKIKRKGKGCKDVDWINPRRGRCMCRDFVNTEVRLWVS